MPLIAPITKVSKCKEFGANIYLYGNNIGLNSDK
jgi:threonine dehydratase